ncbi:MAG: hypothetical protein QOI46_2010, partial [Alphaproteobacteria bacterium]|nr:hypothetical protein [Alphaproteobacteria bacterium]
MNLGARGTAVSQGAQIVTPGSTAHQNRTTVNFKY